MTDAYVYSFMTRDEVADETTVSARLATLEAIKGRGEPVMESQTVVDHTELDNNGFVMSGIGDNSYAANDITAQIRSIELRAASRDREALTLDEGTQGTQTCEIRRQQTIILAGMIPSSHPGDMSC
jgi:hypothetical protein